MNAHVQARATHEPTLSARAPVIADAHATMTGRALAERLGYDPRDLDRIPAEAARAFHGIGYHLDLAALSPGECVADVGCGAGTDSFVASLHVGKRGAVVGIDIDDTPRPEPMQHGFTNVAFLPGPPEQLPLVKGAFDCVISNGAIGMARDRERALREAARALRRGGRIALSDIVSVRSLPPVVAQDTARWASHVGGLLERGAYCSLVEQAGFRLHYVRMNPLYQAPGGFGAGRVESLSLVAIKR